MVYDGRPDCQIEIRINKNQPDNYGKNNEYVGDQPPECVSQCTQHGGSPVVYSSFGLIDLFFDDIGDHLTLLQRDLRQFSTTFWSQPINAGALGDGCPQQTGRCQSRWLQTEIKKPSITTPTIALTQSRCRTRAVPARTLATPFRLPAS